LLANVKEQYEEFKARPPQRGYGDRGPSTGYGGQGGYGDRQGPNRSDSYGGGGYGSYNSSVPAASGTMSPAAQAAPGASTPAPGAAADYAAQYAQYYGGADPYAAYGGYAA
jgi:hypothetical protein